MSLKYEPAARLSSLMVAASLLILAFFYDIFWVFCSSELFGKNVMVHVMPQFTDSYRESSVST